MSGRVGTIITPTWDEFIRKDVVELGGTALANMDESGLGSALPHRSDTAMRDFLKEIAGNFNCLREKGMLFGSQQAIENITSYYYSYDALGSDKFVLPFSLAIVDPRPTDIRQIKLTRNGALQAAGTHYKLVSTGISLNTALESGDECVLIVYSLDIARVREVHWYLGSIGTGSGNRVFALDSLGSDFDDSSMSLFPALPSRLFVFRNGLQCRSVGSNADYSVAGTGENTVVTFNYDIEDDEEITFEVQND